MAFKPCSDADQYGSRFVADTYPNLVFSADKYFGGIVVLSAALALAGWERGEVPLRGVFLRLAFMVSNLLVSQIALRTRGKSRVRIELFRIFVLNAVFCPVLFVGVGGTLFPWWPGYFIAAIGAAVVIGAVWPGCRVKGPLGIALLSLNLAITGALTLDRQAYYQLAIYVGTLFLSGIAFLRYTEAFISRARLENGYYQSSLQAIRAAQAQLVESGKLSALGQMAGGIAHEINSPVAAIQLAVRQARRAVDAPEVDRSVLLDRLSLISSVSDRITRIVSGLRSFCKDSSSEPLRVVPIESLISDTLVFCEERFRTGGVSLEVGHVSPGLDVECRPIQISQVLLNLLNNAYDAARLLPEKRVRLKVEELDGAVSLTVQDSGTGIPDPIRLKIFEPFFTTKEIGVGTGLGLSISRNIIESHRGTIRLDATVPNTSFVIQIPRRQASSRV